MEVLFILMLCVKFLQCGGSNDDNSVIIQSDAVFLSKYENWNGTIVICKDDNEVLYECDTFESYCTDSTNSCFPCKDECKIELMKLFQSTKEFCEEKCAGFLRKTALEAKNEQLEQLLDKTRESQEFQRKALILGFAFTLFGFSLLVILCKCKRLGKLYLCLKKIRNFVLCSNEDFSEIQQAELKSVDVYTQTIDEGKENEPDLKESYCLLNPKLVSPPTRDPETRPLMTEDQSENYKDIYNPNSKHQYVDLKHQEKRYQTEG